MFEDYEFRSIRQCELSFPAVASICSLSHVALTRQIGHEAAVVVERRFPGDGRVHAVSLHSSQLHNDLPIASR